MSNLSVVNTEGRKFEVRIVDTGDNYGLNNCLVNDSDPMVEFWDMNTFPEGQFVSRYYVSTILEDESGGLNLDGGVPEWFIDGSAMSPVYDFLKGKE